LALLYPIVSFDDDDDEEDLGDSPFDFFEEDSGDDPFVDSENFFTPLDEDPGMSVDIFPDDADEGIPDLAIDSLTSVSSFGEGAAGIFGRDLFGDEDETAEGLRVAENDIGHTLQEEGSAEAVEALVRKNIADSYGALPVSRGTLRSGSGVG